MAAILEDRLARLATSLDAGGSGEDGIWSRHLAKLLRDKDLLQRELDKRPAAATIPPGMPIGDTGWFDD